MGDGDGTVNLRSVAKFYIYSIVNWIFYLQEVLYTSVMLNTFDGMKPQKYKMCVEYLKFLQQKTKASN